MNYLSFMPNADHDAIHDLSREMRQRLAHNKKGYLRYREPLESLKGLQAGFTDFCGDTVRIGQRQEISQARYDELYQCMRNLMPWRKGPFEVFGIEIDAEWRSERKWNRVKRILPDLNGKIIADIGSSNGYYMFRMAQEQPAVVLGFEPYIHHYFAFQTLNSLAGQENLYTEPFGVEEITLFPESFDLIFLMGIIYHRISPVEMLKELREALKPKGALIIESQAIPGREPVALFPAKRYAKAPGTYFVPTAVCLHNWLTRSGFTEVELFDSHPMSKKEQRQTDWMTFESYQDFIDPDNPELTVEGYPAPIRVYLMARK